MFLLRVRLVLVGLMCFFGYLFSWLLAVPVTRTFNILVQHQRVKYFERSLPIQPLPWPSIESIFYLSNAFF